jgi:hypothetical protein
MSTVFSMWPNPSLWTQSEWTGRARPSSMKSNSRMNMWKWKWRIQRFSNLLKKYCIKCKQTAFLQAVKLRSEIEALNTRKEELKDAETMTAKHLNLNETFISNVSSLSVTLFLNCKHNR